MSSGSISALAGKHQSAGSLSVTKHSSVQIQAPLITGTRKRDPEQEEMMRRRRSIQYPPQIEPVDLGNMSLWSAIQERLLPYFAGFGWKTSMEEVNHLVKRWIHEVSNDTLEQELSLFFKTGMLSMANKLAAAADESFASRAGEIWVFFFGTVLPLIQALGLILGCLSTTQ
ncbi:hypothetical protein EDD86DRAFT_84331 [Gorgonomyces haynaldii]|nr:hypothetical protein EDD86DRAFT_84331 [Gorgonomyces haynaldii]